MANNVLVDILVNDKPISQYSHNGEMFVEGRAKSPYKIRIKNNSWKRVKAVISVDGLSVMDGQPASENSTGYIIAGYSTSVIDGWRLTEDSVAQFVKKKKKNSYSAKLGEGVQNTGVIGIVFFEEKQYHYNTVAWNSFDAPYSHTIQPMWLVNNNVNLGAMRGIGISASSAVGQNSAATAKSLSRRVSSDTVSTAYTSDSFSEPVTQNLGTEFGKETHSAATKTSFQQESYASQRTVIYYDDRRGLEARGIFMGRRKPDPFPASNTQYCKRV